MLASPIAADDLANGTSPGRDPVVRSHPYPCSDTYIVDAHGPPFPEWGPILLMFLYLHWKAEESADSSLVGKRVEVDGT